MRNAAREYGAGMQEGKFLEGALLGRPKEFEPSIEMGPGMTVGRVRAWLNRNLRYEMQEIRKNQTEDPSLPKRKFPKNLVMDIEAELEDSFDMEDRYEIRFNTAVGTLLDYAGGVDFWVELYDKQGKHVISDYKIDLTANAEKTQPGHLADFVYFYDLDLDNPDNKNAIFESVDYQELVKNAAATLKLNAEKRSDIYNRRARIATHLQL